MPMGYVWREKGKWKKREFKISLAMFKIRIFENKFRIVGIGSRQAGCT